MLGQQMVQLHELQREYDDPNSNLDKTIAASHIERARAAKELFITASEKLFTPSEKQDPKQEARAIADVYKSMNLGVDDGFTASLEADFEYLAESTEDPNDFRKSLENASQRLGESLGQEVWYLAQNTDELSLKQEDRKHLVMAAGNKLLYRLEKTREQVRS